MRVLPDVVMVSEDMIELSSPFMTSWGDVIRTGFYWNGMTANWAVGLPKFGDSVNIASLEHDYIYVYEGVLPSGKVIPRIDADKMLRYNLLVDGNPMWKCELAYVFVRLFGGVLWKRKDSRAIGL